MLAWQRRFPQIGDVRRPPNTGYHCDVANDCVPAVGEEPVRPCVVEPHIDGARVEHVLLEECLVTFGDARQEGAQRR